MSVPGQKFSLKLTIKPSGERSRIKAAILGLGEVRWEEKAEQYCEYRLDGKSSGGWLRAKQFTNGTLYLEASGEDGLARLAQVAGGTVSVSSEKVVKEVKAERPRGDLGLRGTYAGTDESGKGDYFGPLVIAGVVVTEETVPILGELGVMDSKKLNGKAIVELSRQIVQVVGEGGFSIVEIGPGKYNELYEKFRGSGKNLNHLLAWGHARVIENLLGTRPECGVVVADQFGSEHYIQSQLQARGKGIKLMQTPKAEANMGVAAASILARNRFVEKVGKLSRVYGVELPTGAGPQVKVQAKRFIESHGREKLGEVAKLHFKTTQEL